MEKWLADIRVELWGCQVGRRNGIDQRVLLRVKELVERWKGWLIRRMGGWKRGWQVGIGNGGWVRCGIIMELLMD